MTGTLQPVHVLNAEVPKPLSDVVTKAMARSPDDRYQDALEMQQALMTAAEVALGTSVRRTLSDMPPITPGESSIGAGQPLAPPRMSQDRLRTLEFALDLEESAQPAPQAPVAVPGPRPPRRGRSRK